MATVVFDLDGVLIRSRKPDKTFLWSQKMDETLAIPKIVRDGLFAFPVWHEVLTGQREFIDHIRALFKTHSTATPPAQFIDFWLNNDLNWYPDAIELASSLKVRNHNLVIATNQDKLRSDFIKDQPLVVELFSAVIPSCELGFTKPDPAFFHSVQRKMMPAGEVILIDDDSRNIEAAKGVGWSGIHFNPDLDPQFTFPVLRQQLAHLL